MKLSQIKPEDLKPGLEIRDKFHNNRIGMVLDILPPDDDTIVKSPLLGIAFPGQQTLFIRHVFAETIEVKDPVN